MYVSENLFKDVSLVELLVKKDGFGLMVVANEIIDECMVNKAEIYISLTLLYWKAAEEFYHVMPCFIWLLLYMPLPFS